MADIQFNEPRYARPSASVHRHSWVTGLVIRSGLAADERSAQKTLLVVLVLTIAGIVAIFVLNGSGGAVVPVPEPIV
jgi:hypothetical protein